jgi:hypothetical protein
LHCIQLNLTNQLTRDDAVRLLKQSPYPTEAELNDDLKYFLKKMGWNQTKLDEYLHSPRIEHEVYGSEKWLHSLIHDLGRKFIPIKLRNYLRN